VDPAARKTYQALIKREAKRTVTTDIADAVAAIESGYDPGAIGSVGEIGLMQVRPKQRRCWLQSDLTELAKPDVNIHYGVTYLSQVASCQRRSLPRSDEIRAGHGEEMMSALSRPIAPGASASGGGWLALRGVNFRAICVRAASAASTTAIHRPRIRTAAVSRLFGGGRSKSEGDRQTHRVQMGAHGVAVKAPSTPLDKPETLRSLRAVDQLRIALPPRIDRNRLFKTKTIEIMRSARLGASAERLNPPKVGCDDGADHIAIDIAISAAAVLRYD